MSTAKPAVASMTVMPARGCASWLSTSRRRMRRGAGLPLPAAREEEEEGAAASASSSSASFVFAAAVVVVAAADAGDAGVPSGFHLTALTRAFFAMSFASLASL